MTRPLICDREGFDNSESALIIRYLCFQGLRHEKKLNPAVSGPLGFPIFPHKNIS